MKTKKLAMKRQGSRISKEYRRMRKFMRNVMKSSDDEKGGKHAINHDSSDQETGDMLKEPLLK